MSTLEYIKMYHKDNKICTILRINKLIKEVKYP